jgi:hypothetical protein
VAFYSKYITALTLESFLFFSAPVTISGQLSLAQTSGAANADWQRMPMSTVSTPNRTNLDANKLEPMTGNPILRNKTVLFFEPWSGIVQTARC